MPHAALVTDFLTDATPWVMRGILLLLLAAICISDFRTRCIPNDLVIVGFSVGLAWQTFGAPGAGLFDPEGPGALGVGAALGGASTAFACFLFFYLMRTMGAGDVKLMAVMGAFFGFEAVPALILLVLLAGGCLVLLRLFDGVRRRAIFANLQLIVFGQLAALTGGVGPQFDPRTDSADRMPYAFAISGGALLLGALQLMGVIT